MRKLIEHPVDFKKSISYINRIVECFLPSMDEFISSFDFKKGDFFSEIPETVYLDRLHSFELSGIIPATDLLEKKQVLPTGEMYIPKCIYTTRRELKFAIYEYLKLNPMNLVSILRERNQWNLIHESSIREISNRVCRFSPYEPFFVILQECNKGRKNLDFTRKRVGEKIRKIYISAYDGEAFLVWKQNQNV